MERWAIYDEHRKPTGRIHVRGKPMKNGDYHIVIHVWIQNTAVSGAQKRFLISRRHPDKPFGNMWETCGGSVVSGEDSLIGALREAHEELGVVLNRDSGVLLKSWRRDRDFVEVWLFETDEGTPITMQPEEVIDTRWATAAEVGDLLESGRMAPSLSYFYELFK